MIEIQDIRTNSVDDIINRLLDEKTQPFEIYVPKSTQLFASTYEDIANDYAMLAFAGQKLNEIADEFSYYYVSPSDHESILFEVKTNDINQLAKAILFLSFGYSNEPQDEEIIYFDDVYDFIEKVDTGEIIPACPDFIEDYQEYREQVDGEEDEE